MILSRAHERQGFEPWTRCLDPLTGPGRGSDVPASQKSGEQNQQQL
jgi:hypothetical protein